MRRARVRHFVYMEIIRGCQMETITSRENAKIKYACRLREEEKLRTADGLFFAEGPKLCLELARGCTLQTLYATEKALAHTPELEAFAGKTVLVTEPVAQKLSGTKTSQDGTPYSGTGSGAGPRQCGHPAAQRGGLWL